jgi:dienelactone hydrolase
LCAVSFSQAQGKNFADFSLKALQSYPYKSSVITIEALAFKNNLQYAYNFTYTTMGLTVSGRFSLPVIPAQNIKGIILMLRGHQYPGGYYTGKGTENPARRYLEGGYAVIAPDFLGYGPSSPAPSPGELHQLYSVINAVELYTSLLNPAWTFSSRVPQADRATLPSSFKKIVLWGHSNGGQVAIHFLEVTGKPIPTVLWAPVSLAYPDSIAHYQKDRGKWVEDFKQNYPAADFSLFNYLGSIAPGTPILLEQGTNDTAVPKSWNDAFAKAVNEENAKRAGRGNINLTYEIYEKANHNLNPFWGRVLPGDLAFWDKY